MDCDILKAPHHGAGDAYLEEFALAASPDITVVSTGKNVYGHPAAFVLSRYGEIGGEVYRTDLCGTVEIRLYPNGEKRVKTLYENS